MKSLYDYLHSSLEGRYFLDIRTDTLVEVKTINVPANCADLPKDDPFILARGVLDSEPHSIPIRDIGYYRIPTNKEVSNVQDELVRRHNDLSGKIERLSLVLEPKK